MSSGPAVSFAFFPMILMTLLGLGLFLFVFFVVRGLFGGKSEKTSEGQPRARTQLAQCPGCGAPLTEGTENCSQCGLRVGI